MVTLDTSISPRRRSDKSEAGTSETNIALHTDNGGALMRLEIPANAERIA